MGKIEFKRNWRGDDYTCGCHFKCNGADHSGDYYPAADYEAIEAKLATCEALLQEHQTRANYPTKCVDNDEEDPYSERNMRRHGER